MRPARTVLRWTLGVALVTWRYLWMTTPLHRRIETGDELVVRLPGPWNGPVRVVEREQAGFRLATLRGHMEAGQVRLRADGGEDGAAWFVVETWAQPGNRLVDLRYTRLRVGREIQLNMWVRCCLAAARLARGRARGGVRIHNRILPADRVTPPHHAPQAPPRRARRRGPTPSWSRG